VRRRRRRGRGVPLSVALVLLALLAALVAVVDAVEHVALFAAAAGIAAGAFAAGRRWERRRATGKTPRGAGRVTPGPDRAGQVAELERLAGRPIEAVIASYRQIQRKYSGG
jgi:hypothetical protein